MAVKQTAGRDALGEFAPKFAELNDDVLFGQVWSREDNLSLRDRSIVTVVALMAQGLTDSLVSVSPDVSKEQRCDENGNSGDFDPCSILCGLAQGVGGFPYGKGCLGGGQYCRRKIQTPERDGIPLSVHPMTPLRNTLSAKATSLLFLRSRSAFTM